MLSTWCGRGSSFEAFLGLLVLKQVLCAVSASQSPGLWLDWPPWCLLSLEDTLQQQPSGNFENVSILFNRNVSKILSFRCVINIKPLLVRLYNIFLYQAFKIWCVSYIDTIS